MEIRDVTLICMTIYFTVENEVSFVISLISMEMLTALLVMYMEMCDVTLIWDTP